MYVCQCVSACWATRTRELPLLFLRRMSERGRRTIVNIDLQFVNSRIHFSKCQACFSTIVSGLFSHRAPDEDKVTTLWWGASRRKMGKKLPFPFLLCQKKARWDWAGRHFQMFGNRKMRGVRSGMAPLYRLMHTLLNVLLQSTNLTNSVFHHLKLHQRDCAN